MRFCSRLIVFSIFVITQSAWAQEAAWRRIEQQAHGDLAAMLRIVEQAPPIRQVRLTDSAATLTEKLERAGRFRDLGLTREEGATLVRAVYRSLGLSLDGVPAQPLAAASATAAALPFPYRAGTEFERLSGVLLRWPFDWNALRDEYAAMIAAYATTGVTAFVWVDNDVQQNAAANYLTEAGVYQGHIEWIVENTDSVWIRDYGPQFLISTSGPERGVADFHYYNSRPADDDTPLAVAGMFALPVVDRQRRQTVYTEGGNLGHDGLGSVIYSERTYRNNRAPNSIVDQRILSAFQAHQKIVLADPSLDSTGHVDMFTKIVNGSTILVAQYDADEVDYAVLEQAAAQLSTSTNGAGQPWNVVRIPQPDVYYARFVLPVVRTYTNAQMANNVVIVPTYGLPSDAVALSIFQSVLPGRQIIGLDANDIIEAGGA